MLNEDLYECLVELGINEHKARKAAKENAELLEMSADIVTVRQTVFELTRQSSGMNERLINVEALIKALIQRFNSVDQWQSKTNQHLSELDTKLDGVEGKLSSAVGKLSAVEERLNHVELELMDIKGMLTLLVEKQ